MKPARRDVFFLIGTVALLVFMLEDVRALIAYASDWDNKNASQVLLVPFVSGMLLFLGRARIFSDVRYSPLAGLLTILAGAGLLLAARTWGLQFNEGDRLTLTTSAIVVSWLGTFLLFYGKAAFRAALFPLLFLGLSIPIPSVLMNPAIAFLQRGSADISFLLLKLTGTPIYREGFRFAMPGLTIEVAPECSGIRSCIAMLVLSIMGGQILLTSWWRRMVLVFAAIPIMIFKNAIRIGTLSLLSIHVDPRILESRLHREGGIPFFIVALVLLYPILKMLMKSERNGQDGQTPVLREVNP